MSTKPESKSLKKNFSLQEKYEIIVLHEQNGTRIKDLQSKFGCGKTQLYRMFKQRDEIKAEYLSGAKNPKTKRSVKCTPNNEINSAALKWYKEARRRSENVTGFAIKAKALEIADKLGITTFKASNGWLQSFQYRNNIKLAVDKTKQDKSPARDSTESPVQPKHDPLHNDDEDILSALDETPPDTKTFHKSYKIILNEKSTELDSSTEICTAYETVLYYNTLPDDKTGEYTDQITILFCYYDDGTSEKPLITLNESNYLKMRKQYFNNFVVKSNATGLLTLKYMVEYLTTLNSKLALNGRRITLRLDNKFSKFTFGHLSNIVLDFESSHNGNAVVTDFKLQYRNLLLNGYIPFVCNSSKKLTFLKYFDLNDAIKLILKSIGNLNFCSSTDDIGSYNSRSELHDKMVICEFRNSCTDSYLNIDAFDIVDDSGTFNADDAGDDGDSEDEDKIISLSKATIYLIEIKKMLMKRGGDDRLIDKVDELQSDLNEMCFEEKRINLI